MISDQPRPPEQIADPSGTGTSTDLAWLRDQIDGLGATVNELRDLLLDQKVVKESYTTKEVAQILNKKPFTVREYCRLQRVRATKAMCGRGSEEEWRISHEELLRIQNEGLLPVPKHY